MLALKHGSAKDRKTIIKSFKTYIGKVGNCAKCQVQITCISRFASRSTG